MRILKSVKKLAKEVENGTLKADDISEEMIASNLYTAGYTRSGYDHSYKRGNTTEQLPVVAMRIQ